MERGKERIRIEKKKNILKHKFSWISRHKKIDGKKRRRVWVFFYWCVSLTMCQHYFHFSSFLRWQMSNCNFSCPCFRLFIPISVLIFSIISLLLLLHTHNDWSHNRLDRLLVLCLARSSECMREWYESGSIALQLFWSAPNSHWFPEIQLMKIFCCCCCCYAADSFACSICPIYVRIDVYKLRFSRVCVSICSVMSGVCVSLSQFIIQMYIKLLVLALSSSLNEWIISRRRMKK